PPPPLFPPRQVTIRPVPLTQVQRGATLSVEYRFRNQSSTDIIASDTLQVIYQQRLLTFTSVSPAPGDRYLFHDGSAVAVEVTNVAPGEERRGRINFFVRRDAPLQSQIGLFAVFRCSPSQTCNSNLAEVEVIANQDETTNGGTFAMGVSPDRGPIGTAHIFQGSRFLPGEEFRTWLNLPGGGVMPLSITGNADAQGNIRFTFGSGGLTQAGFYSMVAHGMSSSVQNVAPFIVQINGQPATMPGMAGGSDLMLPVTPFEVPATPILAGTGGLAGTVRDATGTGLAGIVVEVLDSQGDIITVTRTITDGAYAIATGLETGTYTVKALPGATGDPSVRFRHAPAGAQPQAWLCLAAHPSTG
ncbi:MAG: carboxypeptidase regulatory-like domain-containing protein, partial [Chloroflexia bacterium]|nr:carboxypeptidase regulatory-like domain-containing protein [Chloroflexia bacterium]